MPTRVVDTPLGLSCVFSDGSRAEFDLDGIGRTPGWRVIWPSGWWS